MPYRPETLAAQALGEEAIDATGSVVPPIHPSTTYIVGNPQQRIYARADNPTFEHAESLLTALEDGAASILFSSGMAAATTVFQVLSPGDHVVAPKDMYWGLRNWLQDHARRWGLEFTFVELSQSGALEGALRPGRTKLVWTETPSNPLWGVTDIAAAAGLAHAAGARLAIDSTCATPVHTRPIAHGADLVMHAATKFLNGHSDVVAGTLTAARDDDFWKSIVKLRASQGAILGSFEAWLLLRGMRTLFPRVRIASASAMTIARHFSGHPKLEAVLYPGLPDDPGHAIARRQMQDGFGPMLSLRVKAGFAAALEVAQTTRLWKQATSLGGTESLIEHRASVEGPGSNAPPDLVRLATGIEAVEDLIADLEQAIARSS